MCMRKANCPGLSSFRKTSCFPPFLLRKSALDTTRGGQFSGCSVRAGRLADLPAAICTSRCPGNVCVKGEPLGPTRVTSINRSLTFDFENILRHVKVVLVPYIPNFCNLYQMRLINHIYMFRVGWGTMLQAGRTRLRLPMRSLDFLFDLILPDAL
jgi:hypothetical protein